MDHLNSLQSNAAALEKFQPIRTPGMRDAYILETLQFLKRIGYTVSICHGSAAF